MSEVELLEDRQNRILQKLDELKQTLLSMRGDLSICSKPAQQNIQPQQQQQKAGKVKIQRKPIDVNNLAEIVVNVHPKNIPYSILAFRNLFKDRLFLDVDVFTHSSIAEADFNDLTRDFTEKITKKLDYVAKLPSLKVTIIWKDVETTQFISSPSKFIPVYGEINIIRYLNRVGPSEHYYETDNLQANLHDQVLDVCYQLSKKHSDKERQQYIQQLSQRLGKDQFYNSASSLSISDIAVSSVLKKLYANNFKGMPANLSNWLNKISPIAGY
jgi:aminoacyl tRNA synthase complex-interacting multifunctional protein 2